MFSRWLYQFKTRQSAKMTYGYLGQILGRRKSIEYFLWALFVYFVAIIVLSYLFIGSVTEIARSIVFGIDRGGNLAASILLAGILSPICVRVAIRWSIDEHRLSRLILDIVVLSLFIFIVGVASTVGLGAAIVVLTSLLFDQFTLTVDMIFNLVMLIAFAIPALFSVIITWNILPSQKVTKMKEIHSELDKIKKNLILGKSDLEGQRYLDSLQQAECAKYKIDNILNEELPTEGASDRIDTVQSHINELGERSVKGVISEINNQMSSGKYIEAHELLTRIEQANIPHDSHHETIVSMRDEVDGNLSDIASSKMRLMTKSIEMAKQSKRNGEYDEARDHLNDLSEHKSAIAAIDPKYIPAEYNHITNQQDSLRSEIIRAQKEAQIQTHISQIAELLNINENQVRLNLDELELYQELEQALTKLDELKREYPNQSWNQIEFNIKNGISGNKLITSDDIQTYNEILSRSEKILEYIETVGESHPSIHPVEWRETVDTGLEERSSEILDPVVLEIEQLNKGLWKRENLHQMSWQEFEHLVGSLYKSLGYTTEVTQGTSDMGVDVWAEDDGVRRAIQVKQFDRSNTVGREPLQKTVSAIAKGDADEAVVVTSSRFTRTAKKYAADFGPELELVAGDRLIEKLSLSDVPPPTPEDSETNSVDTATQQVAADSSPTDIGIPLTAKNGNWNNEGKYPYKRFNDATENIKELKRKREHEKAEELLLWCINFAESETKPGVRDHPRWYYKHLAIIYRKENRYQDEVDILQRYVSFCNSMNIEPRDEIISRLNKAKQYTAE